MSDHGAQRCDLSVCMTWDGRPLPEEAVAHVSLRLDTTGLTITVDAPFHGDIAPDVPAGSVWKLWEHEVVEVFILGPGEAYTEVELGPHGHHLILRLEGRRNIVEQVGQLAFEVSHDGGRWRGQAHLGARFLPAAPYRLNAYSIHGAGEGRRYAAAFPASGDAPDFHRLETFQPWPISSGG